MIGQLRAHPLAKSVGVLLIACVLLALPFALAMAGTAWVRITNLAILFVLIAVLIFRPSGLLGERVADRA